MATIIDFHTHLFPADVVSGREDYLRRDPVFRSLYESPQAAIATVDGLLAAMDRAGVERSVACGFGWSTPQLCHAGNDAIVDAVQRHPDRIVGFGTVAPRASLEASVEEIERLAAAGVRGLGELRPDSQGLLEMAPEELAPIAEALRQHGMALLLHASEPVGHQYAGKERATPDRLEVFLTAFAGIPVILAHGGGGLPFYAYMPEVREALADIYVDTAAFPYLYAPEVVRGLGVAIGMDRILFGSDYPLMPQERVIAYLDRAGLTDDERQAILSGNAERLLKRIAVPS